jgi:hypothetical protein
VPQALVFLMFAAVFPLHLRTVLGLIRLHVNAKDLLRSVPKVAAVGMIVLTVGYVALFFSAITHLPGQPEHLNGRYYFNHYGSLIPTDEAGYHHAVARQERIFSGGPAVFYALAVVVNLALLNRRRSDTTEL